MEASEDIRGYREIVMAAVNSINQDGWALEFVSDNLWRDRERVMAVVKQYEWALNSASEDLQRDREILMAAVKQNEHALQFA